MDNKLVELVEEGSGCLDEDGKAHFRDANHVEALISQIISKLDFPHNEYKLSGYVFERNLRSIIGKIGPEDDVEDAFTDSLGELKEELGTSNEHEYTIFFPLSIRLNSGRQETFCIENVEIKEIGEDSWTENIEDLEENDDFRIRTIDYPHDLFDGGSFWKTTVSALDSRFALERTQFVLKTFLSEINFLQHYRQLRSFDIPASHPWPNTWSNIRLPPLFVVFQGGTFNDVEFSRDISPIREVEINEDVLKRLDELPSFCNKNELDDYLISGLQLYLSGITSPSNEEAFLEFWRSLETLTLSKPGDISRDVTDRASSIISNRDEGLLPDQLDRAIDIRNETVHADANPSISHSDINTLKQLTDYLLSFYIGKQDTWSVSDIRFVLHKCNPTDEDILIQQKEARENNRDKIDREIEILDRLIEETSSH